VDFPNVLFSYDDLGEVWHMLPQIVNGWKGGRIAHPPQAASLPHPAENVIYFAPGGILMSALRYLLAPVGVAAALALAGCAAPRHTTDEKYCLVAANIKLPYWQSALAGLSHAAGDLKVAYELAGPDTYDPKAEQAVMHKLVERQPPPSGILISAADPGLLGPEIEAAMRKGIPVITMDSDAVSSPRILFIGTDNHKAGMMGGQQVAKLLQGKGSVVILSMPEQLNLNQRLQGYRDALASHPQIAISRVVDLKGDPRIAFDSTKELLGAKTKPSAFVCLVSFACAEVAEVVKRENQQGKIVIVAMDTEQRTLEGIQSGVIAATVGQKPFTMAYHGVMLLDTFHHHPLQPLIADRINDSNSPVPAFVDTGATLIDKTNVAAFLSQQRGSGGT
jgi:ribose transport system substrate-binding protein